ncbi:pentatricopeptide repeat-containing protein At1g11290, chloroplastic-like [Cornus florida]|uniref:pentatricopeptide repeat-containing protein At1g11290, chloroplastic-like n=1 Tax=Cornus florida TaxID=4283 RepID=UPI00289C8859|nr:pentatricopeptide repeat-containing protein At1g11290, chloroplastic-like [Cornus florida]
MSLRFPNFHLRCTLENAANTANQLFSRALTIRNYHSSHPEDDFISCDDQTFNWECNSDPIDLNFLVQLQHHGSVHIPYILNKIVSYCAKTSSFYVGIQVHSTIIKMGLNSNVFIGSALVDMYGKCRMISSARQMFDEMRHRNVVTWNSLISGYMQTNYSETSVKLFLEMLRAGIAPTSFSVSAVLIGCTRLEDGELGSQMHGLSLKAGFCFNVVVGTGLIDMYSKCVSVDDSRRVFNQMPDKNVVTWTSMVTGYAQNQLPDEALILVREMLRLGPKPNHVTYNTLLSSFHYPDDLDRCKQVHCRIIREGLEANAFLAVTLVTLYSECSTSLEGFYKICSNITIWDQISWNAVISGFTNLGYVDDAIICFSKMRQGGINVDFFTFTSILRAVGIISALEEGKQTHALIFKTGYASNMWVQNGLVSMYARCGRIDDAKMVFSSMGEHDLISWNSVLSGCAHHGYGKEAVEMLEEMRKTGVKPDLTTFLAVLSACSHAGLLEKGLEYFDLMRNDDFHQPPKVEHYACIVDLYGRAGYLHKAEAFINTMPIEPGPSVFKALLSASQVHGNMEIATRCARKLVELCPNDPATYILLSNVLATGGCWSDAAGVRKLMYDKGVRKKPAYSWV